MPHNPSPLRPSPFARPAAAQPRHTQTKPWRAALLLSAILLLTLLAILYIPRPGKLSPVAASQPLAAPSAQLPPQTDPTSDGGIIFGGMPRARRPDIRFTILKNQAYIVGYSEDRRDPLWSAYHVFHADGPVHEERPKGNFLTDNRTQARVTHHDFTGSGYDRGHMAPNFAIATRFGPAAQLETFLLSNICPQSPALNEKVWARLEKDEIDYANRLGDVWVIDGPIFDDLAGGTPHKLRTGIAIPSSFYKIIIENHTGHPRLFSVIMPQNVQGTEQPPQFLTSIRTIEEKTQLIFLSALTPATQQTLKAKTWPMW